jgi:hypothetical protein
LGGLRDALDNSGRNFYGTVNGLFGLDGSYCVGAFLVFCKDYEDAAVGTLGDCNRLDALFYVIRQASKFLYG